MRSPAMVPRLAPEEGLSLEALYRAHAADVARWAARLGGPRVDPEDVVQEVFLTVRRRLSEFRGDALVTTWLFQITTRIVANHRRAAWLRRIWPGSHQAMNQEASVADWPSSALDARERTKMLYRLLDQLPARQRQVLVLFELEEMSTADISVLINVPGPTVRVWLHRARAKLLRDVDGLRAQEAL